MEDGRRTDGARVFSNNDPHQNRSKMKAYRTYALIRTIGWVEAPSHTSHILQSVVSDYTNTDRQSCNDSSQSVDVRTKPFVVSNDAGSPKRTARRSRQRTTSTPVFSEMMSDTCESIQQSVVSKVCSYTKFSVVQCDLKGAVVHYDIQHREWRHTFRTLRFRSAAPRATAAR